MKKWFILLIILMSLVYPGKQVLANDSSEVQVYATPACGILNLTAVYVNDRRIDLSWEVSAGIANTMVRVDFGSFPTDRNDGYEVYYGPDLSCSDTTIDLASFETPFYRAWGQLGSGSWVESNNWLEVLFMSSSWLFISLIVLALGATGLSFWRRSIVLSMGAAMGWTTLGLLLLTTTVILGQYLISEGWVRVLAFLFFSMAVGCLLWFVSGIGKTKITMTNIKGQSWQMWGKPPKQGVIPRSKQVKERHKERLAAIRGRRMR